MAEIFQLNYGGEIEKYPLNPLENEIRDGYQIFEVEMSREGDTILIKNTDEIIYMDEASSGEIEIIDDSFYTYVMAKDEKHAVKIANERRIQKITLENL